MKRLFIGIVFSEEIIGEIEVFCKSLRLIDLDGSFVPRENVHVTLKFLGGVDEARIPGIIAKIQNALAGFRKFSAPVRGVGVFPSLERIEVVWVGVVSSEMVQLMRVIKEELSDIRAEEFEEDVPHATVLRVKSGKGKPLLQALVGKWGRAEFGKLFVDKVVLYESVLSSEGAKYKIVNEFKLK